MKIYIACFDNRYKLPEDVLYFLAYTSRRCDLTFLCPKVPSSLSRLTECSEPLNGLHVIPVSSLPFYNYVQSIFDTRFINYSTNPYGFEQACFHRWLALNSATTHLDSNDYVCLLDTDFLIGISPEEILRLAYKESNQLDLDFIADWESDESDVICPALTLIKKRSLHHFCKYLLVDFFSETNSSMLLADYFDRIGNGLPGGICDMRALAKWRKTYSVASFNLREFRELNIVSNLNIFIEMQDELALDWQIDFGPDSQELFQRDGMTRLIGTHFQGDAKRFLVFLSKLKTGSSSLRSQDVREMWSSHKMQAKKSLPRKIKKLLHLFS